MKMGDILSEKKENFILTRVEGIFIKERALINFRGIRDGVFSLNCH